MINSQQLIKEYCYNNNLAQPSVSGDNQYISGDTILYLTDDADKIKMYYRMANIKLKYAQEILRVSIIKLNVDVSLEDVLLPQNHQFAIVHLKKCEKLNTYRNADLIEYLDIVRVLFKKKLSTELLEEIPASRIVNKMKKGIVKKPIYWKEISYKLIALIEELKKQHINVVIDPDRLTYSNNKFVWKWLK
jgi:hypothetical protein